MSGSLAILSICLVLHAVLVQWTGPWWLPNLTLIGMLLSIARPPRWWLPLSLVAALFTLSGSVRFPRIILLAYVALGWLLQWLAERWDVSDARVQELVAVLACAVLTGSALWLDGLWSWSLAAAAAGHVALTGLALHVLRRVA